ncbi:splicing factor C9orf78 homolog isoform X3 [Pongo pygmaeus]|uniref:splicing factor C9orf78 homolog isoform X3 n=1 Tax=Pongo pygmaeus TaxID=9600 RepID=UPI00300D947B
MHCAVALLVGEKVQEETTLVDDPFQMKTGGMVDMKKLKERGKDKISEEEDLHLGTSFSAETNRRDEDADMMKYIETELKKRKGIVEHEEQKVKPKNAEDCLYELPENIRVSSAKKTEEMLSNQMLSGIPEVDLGIDAKIKNIISTEDAKARLLAEQQNKKKDSETSFVPTNMAVNYVQHNRFYHEELNAPIRRNKEEPKARPLRVGDTEKPEPERECNKGLGAAWSAQQCGNPWRQDAAGDRVELGIGAGASGFQSMFWTMTVCLPLSKPQFPHWNPNRNYLLGLL